MKRTLLCAKWPHNNSYVGGVISILNVYLRNSALFLENGYELEQFDCQLSAKWEKWNSKLVNLFYIFRQRAALKKRLKQNADVVVNIHTSREYLFLKDIRLGKMAACRFGCPVVVTVHVGDIDTVFHRIGFVRKRLVRIMNKYIDKMVFLSKEIQAQFIAAGVNAAQTEVLYNFHCLVPFGQEKALPPVAKLHLLYVGALHREKGVIELLTALAELSDVDFHLDVCGKLTDRSIKAEFETLAVQLGKKITLHGYVSGEQKTALFERADVLILPSYHEGMPLVVLEAMASRCAVVSTKVGATPEILDESNAMWVRERSAEDIKRAVYQLYTSPALLNKLKETNLQKSYEFTLEQNVERLCHIYKCAENERCEI